MIELSEEDRAALRAHLCETFGKQHDVEQEFTPREVAIYLAGIRAGLERAAKVCDESDPATDYAPDAIAACAVAIRALTR